MASISRIEALLLASLALLSFPLSFAALIFNFASLILVPQSSLRRRLRQSPGFKARKILISGVGNSQGLRLARAFHETGHDVIGVDQEPQAIPIYARWSAALLKFCRLRGTIGENLSTDQSGEVLAQVLKEKAEMWIDCSSSRSLSERTRNMLEQKSDCVSLIVHANDAANFASQSDFLSFARSHELPVPEKYQVTSRDDIHNVLNRSQGKRKYTLNGPDEKTATWPRSRTLLPRRTLSQTYHEVAAVKIAKNTPWLLEQYIEGLERYKTFSIVVHGQVKVFVASANFDSRSQQSIPHTSVLNQALLRCVQNIVKQLEPDFSSHLCVDFVVDEKATDKGVEKSILPIDGRTRIESTALLFHGVSGSVDLVRAYLTLFASPANGVVQRNGIQLRTETDIAMPLVSEKGVYNFGNDILQLLVRPMLQLFAFKIGPVQLARQVLMLIYHIAFWQESTYDFKDPLPFWYLYQLYLPGLLLLYFFRGNGTGKALDIKRMIE